MTFSDKLIYIMNLTSVSSAELARALHIDPSQISRLRRGVRGVPQKTTLLRSMAAYFAAKCGRDYQFNALSELFGSEQMRFAAKRENLAKLLESYLSDDSPGTTAVLERLFQTLNEVEIVSPPVGPFALDEAEQDDRLLVFYGNEGKRQAMRQIISRAANCDTPAVIMISSDENTAWLLEDGDYFEKAKRDMLSLARGGAQIQRIIPPLLNINEVFDSFSLWLPLYLTGNVTPYHLLKLRDGVYQRTLVVVPGTAALIATSVGRQSDSNVTYLATTPALVEYYVQEFVRYRDMCDAALCAYDPATDLERLRQRMNAYYSSPSASIRKSNGLSFISIPREQKLSLLSGSSSALMRMLCAHMAEGVVPDEASFFSRPVTDIMQLALSQEIRAGEICYCFDEETVYTPAQYRAHLEGIVTLLKRYAAYNVVLTDRYPMGCVVYAKRGVGALLFMTQAPYKILDITAPSTFQGLWEYLSHIAGTGLSPEANKRRVLAQLRGLIAQLAEA